MKSTGMVREIDGLGRFVLPKEIRNTLGIQNGDAVEIYTDGNRVILKKYEPGCLFCGNIDDLVLFEGKLICRGCLDKMKAL
ncbi:MAG: AbrB/MazE/SpoVT family DNA-binding domain-containing protein [Ruminococcaceae bacterium]|nr:AbrB/MazE/SpoVT family DNA-binding domain-containing protein [Oscillospiraceae bacterium]